MGRGSNVFHVLIILVDIGFFFETPSHQKQNLVRNNFLFGKSHIILVAIRILDLQRYTKKALFLLSFVRF